MTTNGGWRMRRGTWAEAESWIGRELPPARGADVVTRGDIRRKIEVMGFHSPLYDNDDLARAYGYREAPAPTAMLLTWATPAYWSPGDPAPSPDDSYALPPFPVVDIPAPGDNIVATGIETRYLEPVYPGDRITARSRLVSITRKRTAVGDGAFMTMETTYTNQQDVTVGVELFTVFRYSTDAAADAGDRASD